MSKSIIKNKYKDIVILQKCMKQRSYNLVRLSRHSLLGIYFVNNYHYSVFLWILKSYVYFTFDVFVQLNIVYINKNV